MKARRLRRSSLATTTPAAILSSTWPKSADQLPPRMDYNIRDGYTYMYFKGQPLYPFGFGLSYTTFKLSTCARFKARGQRRLCHRERGRHQYRQPRRRRSGPALCAASALRSRVREQELEGFQRVSVDPGQTKLSTSAAGFAARLLGLKTNAFRVEAEPVSLMIGDSSANLPVSTTIRVQ